nr:unnamed protein product [Ananas comosus var. bracteatus]
MELLWRLLNASSSNSPVDWVLWKLMPPARELSRLGVRFKPKTTPHLADITFDDKNGVLEFPRFPRNGLAIYTVNNLVAMEIGDGWEPTERLFCSYAMFMSELIGGREDATVLIDAGILKIRAEDWLVAATYFGRLAPLNVGGGYQHHFRTLVRAVNAYCMQASKVMRVMGFR